MYIITSYSVALNYIKNIEMKMSPYTPLYLYIYSKQVHSIEMSIQT